MGKIVVWLSNPMDSLDEQLQLRDAMLGELKLDLIRAEQRQKKWADLRRTEEEFHVGEWVLLKLQPCRQ